MKSIGFNWENRLVRIPSDFNLVKTMTTNNVNAADFAYIKRYHDKVVGNRPGNCPLDSSLFKDSAEDIKTIVAVSRGKYKMDTPLRAEATIKAAWSTLESPREERIIEDIQRYLIHNERILEEKGAYMGNKMVQRRGHRARTAQIEKRNRKSTMERYAHLLSVDESGVVNFAHTTD